MKSKNTLSNYRGLIALCYILIFLFQNKTFAANSHNRTHGLNLYKHNQIQNVDTLSFTRSRSDSNLTIEGRWAYGPTTAIDIQNGMACFNRGDNLIIANIGDPLHIVERGSILFKNTTPI